MELGWGLNPRPGEAEKHGSPPPTDGVYAGHDGDDRAVVVKVVKNVEHRGSITPNS